MPNKISKITELKLLIDSYQEQYDRKTLTDSGVSYLKGLKTAYDIVKKKKL